MPPGENLGAGQCGRDRVVVRRWAEVEPIRQAPREFDEDFQPKKTSPLRRSLAPQVASSWQVPRRDRDRCAAAQRYAGRNLSAKRRLIIMAHFYFHIRDRDKLIIDEEGLDLRDLETARIEAIKASRDMLLDAQITDQDISHQIIEICDPSGRVLSTVSLAEGSGGRA